MSDWQVGDLALCVNTRDLRCERTKLTGTAGRRLKRGRIYTVTGLKFNRTGSLSLFLKEDASSRASGAERFVKVTPPEADGFDRETLMLEQHA